MISPVPPSASPKPKPRGRWRRLGRWSLLVVLLALIFHRPLIRFGAIQVAAHYHLTLDFRLSGSLLTNLTVRNLRAQPNGTGPTPVERIKIESLHFDYSIPLLLRYGLGEFLRSYEVHHADLAFVALPSRTPQEHREKLGIAQKLRLILAQPAAYADRVEIEDFNVHVHSPNDDFAFEGIDLRLAPDEIGHLRVKRVALPHVPVWENLNAETSYAGRNLFIKNLTVAPELVLRDVNFDASQRAQHKGSMSLRAEVFGGHLELTIKGDRVATKGENLQHSYDTKTTLSAQGINLRAAAAYFGAPRFPLGTLTSLEAEFTGEPEKPRTWKGEATAAVEGIGPGLLRMSQATARTTIDQGRTQSHGQVAFGPNQVELQGTALLPLSIKDFASTDASVNFQVKAPELENLGAQLASADPWSGSTSGAGTISMKDRAVSGALQLDLQQVQAGRMAAGTGRIMLSVRKIFGTPGWAGLSGETQTDLLGVRWGHFTADRATLHARTNERLIEVQSLELTRGINAIQTRGSVQVPGEGKTWARTPIEAQLTIEAPDLAAFGFALKGATLSGQLAGKGAIKMVDGGPAGGLELNGQQLKLGEFAAPQLEVRIKASDQVAQLEQLALRLGGDDRITLTGQLHLDGSQPYQGSLQAQVKDLASLQPLASIFGVNVPLKGALNSSWTGRGQLLEPTHEGELTLHLNKARYGAVDLAEVRLAGLYGKDFAKTTELQITSGSTQATGDLEWAEGKLRLRNLALQQGQQLALSGYAIVPLPAQQAAPDPNREDHLAVNLHATNLDLERLLASFGMISPVSGSFTASLLCGGTLATPAAQLKVSARALKAKAAPQFDNAELDLSLSYAEKNLELTAAARQREIQPLTLQAKLPFDLEKAVREKSYDPSQPLAVTLKLPPSSLAFLPKTFPAIRRVDGTAALDFRVGGTFGKPEVRLDLDVNLKGARMTAETIPALGAFRGRLTYANEALTIQELKGELGGGTFKLGGTVKFPELAQLSFGPVIVVPKAIEPVFDLRLESDKVLVLRNDSVTVRADSDVKLAGPWKAANATGTIYIVQSRFFKEIDILPIGLPGRPKPAPKSAARQSTISFPNPPLRDWKFDIAIKTRENDPFGIRGNMANGAAALALRLAGTGLKPWLDGNIRVEKFNANLPFSSLSVTRGFIYFNQDNPFQPMLDLQGESQIRDYIVNAYIFGQANNPQIQLSSEPPLPHADLVSLLATGTTTAELGANAEVLASRAAMLAVKELYQRLFSKGVPPPQTKTGPGNLMDRFQMELGATDNRSGQQQVISRFRINDQLYLIGDAGVDGQFTGRLKYLIRFH